MATKTRRKTKRPKTKYPKPYYPHYQPGVMPYVKPKPVGRNEAEEAALTTVNAIMSIHPSDGLVVQTLIDVLDHPSLYNAASDWMDSTYQYDGFEVRDIPYILGLDGFDILDAKIAANIYNFLWADHVYDMRLSKALVIDYLADQLVHSGGLRLVPISRDEAARFIAEHHSLDGDINPRGLLYTLGVCYGGRMVGAATAGHPSAPWGRGAKKRKVPCDIFNILEVSRIASDGTHKNVVSKVAARFIDLLKHSGRTRDGCLLVTYSLTSEDASGYKALRQKGLRPVACTPGKTKMVGARAGSKKLHVAKHDKIRWEAGPSALPDNPYLLMPGLSRKECEDYG